MDADDILGCAHQARRFGYGTVVLQSGEDPYFEASDVAGIVRRIKSETGLASGGQCLVGRIMSLGRQVGSGLSFGGGQLEASRWAKRGLVRQPPLCTAQPTCPSGGSSSV